VENIICNLSLGSVHTVILPVMCSRAVLTGPVDTGRKHEYTVRLKNAPLLTCYNLDIHDPIMIIFGRRVTEKVRNQTMRCFPTSPI